MISIAICDDEDFFVKREEKIISNYLEKHGYQYKIDSFLSGTELLKSNNLEYYNIAFLDVSMEEIDGMETAMRIRENNKNVFLVFVSAYLVYSTEGYKVDASRYILKNNLMLDAAIEESLYATIQKLDTANYKRRFCFQEGKMDINLSDIVYIESNLHKLYFHMNSTNNIRYSMYEKLDVIDAAIEDIGFCRVHKSYLVNMKYVDNIERYQIVLCDGTKFSIAKTRYSYVKKTFLMYRSEM